MQKVMLWVWVSFTFCWTFLLVPSLLWWSHSLLWIIVMSWWANVASSAAASYSLLTEIRASSRAEK